MKSPVMGGLASLMPPSLGGAGAGPRPPAAPSIDPTDTDMTIAAKDLLSALKERNPTRVAESLQNFISMC